MPRQRKQTKRLLGGYYEEQLANAVKKQAAAEGKTVTDLIREMIMQGIKGYKNGENK